ncbi:hypothetical protein EYZ11_011247 [Aspergillus tanneri]|uniref:Uncharacterized protein n=1 Tax=Aspergillus tanneri TaxID=1220188 RepID=A0A4S3J8Q6_9EURO|nr:hypothetical protein EYZ11_011247 [Aspergillus tanneri]
MERGPRRLWQVAKWARNREARGGVIPTLQGQDGPATTMTQKAEVFQGVFFPQPPPADLLDITIAPEYLTATITNKQSPPINTPLLEGQIEFPPITETKAHKAINRAPPDKAPAPDAIPNRIWKVLAEVPMWPHGTMPMFKMGFLFSRTVPQSTYDLLAMINKGQTLYQSDHQKNRETQQEEPNQLKSFRYDLITNRTLFPPQD